MERAKLTSADVQLAKALLEAVKLREESYDQVAANKATEICQAQEEEQKLRNPSQVYYGVGVDYAQFYRMDLETACEKAASSYPAIGIACARLIYLALDGWWNDAIIWAQAVTDPMGVCAPTTNYCQHGVEHHVPEPEKEEAEPAEDFGWACKQCEANYLAQNKKTASEQ